MERFDLIDEAPYGDEEFPITEKPEMDDMEADKCIQKINNWERYRLFWLDFYAKKVDEVNAKCDRNIEWQKRNLQSYFSMVPHRSTKTMEAYDLPSGRISVAFSKPKLVPNKESILNRFVEQGDDEFIKVKKELDWARYKGRLFIGSNGEVLDKETGEIVTDVDVEMSVPEFSVTINKKGDEKNEGNQDSDA